MTAKTDTATAKNWASLKETPADENLTGAYTDDDIDELIRGAGGDPISIRRESRDQARELWKHSAQQSTRDAQSTAQEDAQPADSSDVVNRQAAPGRSFEITSSEQDLRVKTLLERAGAIESGCDYSLPNTLHTDTYIDIGKLCWSEELLSEVVSILKEELAGERFDSLVSTSWATAT